MSDDIGDAGFPVSKEHAFVGTVFAEAGLSVKEPEFNRAAGRLTDWMKNSIHDAEKQARAEVLASQRAALNHYQKSTELPQELWPHVEQVNKIVAEIRALLEVQPAAKALEELLRQESERVRKEALLDVLAFNSELGCTPQEGYKYLVEALRDTSRLSVENARAIEKRKV